MLPLTLPPMLASLTKPFDSEEFTYEIKWDGYRCLAFLDGATRLQSRNLNDISYLFPELTALHSRVNHSGCLLDGEVIALRDGKPSFLELQKRAQLHNSERIKAASKAIPVVYVVFDLLFLSGQSILNQPLTERRELLASNLTPGDELILAAAIKEKGVAYFKAIAEMGLEGVIAKRSDSVYLPGKRVKTWLKFKRRQVGNFVVCGYLINPTSRGSLSSLVLGAYLNGGFNYFGMVGTGFTITELNVIHTELERLRTDHNPFSGSIKKSANLVWTKPLVVCEVEYLELTDEGSLRHPVFKRFCPNLTARDCQFGEV